MFYLAVNFCVNFLAFLENISLQKEKAFKQTEELERQNKQLVKKVDDITKENVAISQKLMEFQVMT